MKGTLISIFVGALAGVLLTLGSAMHTSRAAVARAAQVQAPAMPAQVTADATARPLIPSATTASEAPFPK
ncbi:MAG TPA: hypothetical protein VMV37_02660 [Gammaproteobacteria bacterium]|nr:hypothetical protein [Gammaproteobacteria bacterium]